MKVDRYAGSNIEEHLDQSLINIVYSLMVLWNGLCIFIWKDPRKLNFIHSCKYMDMNTCYIEKIQVACLKITHLNEHSQLILISR